MLRIVALDPGGTTGWGMFTAEERYDHLDKKSVYTKHKFDCGQLGPQEHHSELYNALGMWQTDHYIVVCESFEYRNRARPGLELISKEYIGVAKLFCEERGIKYIEQTASMGKVRDKSTAFIKPRNLQKLGLWTPGWGHAMDGYGHLLYYMINTAGIMKHELLAKGWRA